MLTAIYDLFCFFRRTMEILAELFCLTQRRSLVASSWLKVENMHCSGRKFMYRISEFPPSFP